VVSGAITAVVIFSASFNTFLTDFLLFMIIWIAPWVGIFLVDYFLRRGTYDSRSLLETRAGVYWRTAGWHIPGVVARDCLAASPGPGDSRQFIGRIHIEVERPGHGNRPGVVLGPAVVGGGVW